MAIILFVFPENREWFIIMAKSIHYEGEITIEAPKKDLRIERTRKSIRSAFEEMICEMDYEKITVKELANRANINRKTFYLHYDSLDDLLRELQDDLAKEFIQRTKGLNRPDDIDKITREFFMSGQGNDKLRERLMCSGSYHNIGMHIVKEIMDGTWGLDVEKDNSDPFVQRIIMTFVSQSTIEIYKQWVADGKRIPLEDIIELTATLVCNGINGLSNS